MLKLGLVKRIGDEASTDIWNSNWIPRDHSLRPFCCTNTTEVAPRFVSDLICPITRTWKVDALEKFFLPMDVQAIQQIPISYIRRPDFLAWHYERTGVFSVRSAYRMLMETKIRRENFLEGRAEPSNSEQDEKAWRKLWKVKVPAKIRLFAWRLAKASLPTGEVRAHRHMANSPICQI
jgi:hypothetical protein